MKLSKRSFIRLLAFTTSLVPAATPLLARGETEQDSKGKPRLLQGPMLGAVSTTSAQVWIRATDDFVAAIEFSEDENFSQSRVSEPQPLRAESDFAAALRADDLAPDTLYHYRILLDGKAPSYDTSLPMQRFRTAPDGAAKFAVGVGSCARVAEDPQQLIWDVAAQRDPELFIWLGDNIYGDSPRAEILADEYQRQRSVARFVPFGLRTSQLAIWDDHDFGLNDADRTFAGKDVGLEVFKRYWANPAYGADKVPGVFFSYSYGGVDFFCLDVRYHRDPNDGPDHGGRTMLGAGQKQWLKEQLLKSNAPFKVLLSGSGWTAAKGAGGDSWASFMRERDELFEFIRQQEINGVVLVSGDTHVAELNAIPWSEHGGYDLYDLVSSPLGQDTSDSWIERRPERRIRQVYFGSVNFGLLSFDMTADDPVLEYNTVNYSGDDVWAPFRLRASELVNGVSTWEQKMDELSRQRYQNTLDGGAYYAPLPEFKN